MTNYEKYHKEMIEHGYMDVQDGKPTTCQTSCSKCDLYRNDTGCLVTLFLWLAEEYKEPKPTLTEKEMYLCKAFNSGYIARDESRVLHFFTNKPQKGLTGWWATNSIYTTIPPNLLFSFIKWEDEKPYSVEKMLTWEIKDE